MDPSEAIAKLQAGGLSETVIAAAVGSTQPTINRIRRGVAEPGYSLGKALVDMALGAEIVDGQACSEATETPQNKAA